MYKVLSLSQTEKIYAKPDFEDYWLNHQSFRTFEPLELRSIIFDQSLDDTVNHQNPITQAILLPTSKYLPIPNQASQNSKINHLTPY